MRLSFAAFPALLAGIVLMGAGCQATSSTPLPGPESRAASSTVATTDSSTPVMSPTLSFSGVRPTAELNKKVQIKTTKGDIVIQIDPEAGPNAASNFVSLVEKNFYQGIIFHRVIPGFMIQGGDPTGTGFSGPGYQIPDDAVKNLPKKDFSPYGVRGYYPKGLVAMARTNAPNSGGSQFFIMVADYPLDPNYAVFGHVISGQDVADAIAAVPKDENDRPLEDVKMTSVTIES